MKKFTFILLLFAVILVMGLIVSPDKADAVKWKKFTKKTYTGKWTLKYDNTYPEYIGNTGTLYMYVKKIKRKSPKKAKIKKMDIWFDGNVATFKSGKLYRKNGKNKLRAVYSDADGVIKATFKKKRKKLKGKYDHVLGEEEWGGTFKLTGSNSAG